MPAMKDIPLTNNEKNVLVASQEILPRANGQYGGIYDAKPGDGLDPVTLTWEHVNVYSTRKESSSIKDCFTKSDDSSIGTSKQILQDVSGIVRPGELLAIMGASGAGKTTMMNVLTGRSGETLSITGDVKVNGRVMGKDIKYISAYVQQEDHFVESLTVREHLMFQAALRIDEEVSDLVRQKRVDDAMAELGLDILADQTIGTPGQTKALSGGERKRLAFASEIITNPALMFCDEPTSGLDAYMAATVVKTLRAMATKGRTILCTIHQPSSEVYALMDRVCLMAEGRVAYIGTTEQALKFFDGVGFPCPLSHNPADFFIQTLAVIPGQEEQCRLQDKMICDAYGRSTRYEEMMDSIDSQSERGQYNMRLSESSEGTMGIYHDIPPDSEGKMKFKASWCKQFKLLLWRTWVNNNRNPAINRARILQILILSIIVGVIYFQQDINQKGIMNINGALFTLELQITFGNCYMVANTFPAEFPVFRRENQDAMYGVDTYFLTHVLAELPVFLFLPILMSLIVYWMIGLFVATANYFTFVAAFLMLALDTVAFGHLISTMMGSVPMAVAMVPAFVNPFLFFGGYLLNLDSVPWYMKPLELLSWFSYVNEVLVVNQWKDVTSIGCEYAHPMVEPLPNGTLIPAGWDTSMCYLDGDSVIQSYNFDEDDMGIDFAAMAILAVLFEALAYLFMYLRSKKK